MPKNFFRSPSYLFSIHNEISWAAPPLSSARRRFAPSPAAQSPAGRNAGTEASSWLPPPHPPPAPKGKPPPRKAGPETAEGPQPECTRHSLFCLFPRVQSAVSRPVSGVYGRRGPPVAVQAPGLFQKFFPAFLGLVHGLTSLGETICAVLPLYATGQPVPG